VSVLAKTKKQVTDSRVGKLPIALPTTVTFTQERGNITLSNNKDTLTLLLHKLIKVSLEDNTLTVTLAEKSQDAKKQWGTTRSLLANMIQGLIVGHKKELIINGVGYRATQSGAALQFALGYSHPVIYNPPQGITLSLPSQTEVVVSGADKQKVGQVAAEIRSLRPPEAYKGKGVRYKDERVICKEVKK
jgi:large subunit ribosomal protein L6